jgi:ATP-binding protein involved in chromosome partitioning
MHSISSAQVEATLAAYQDPYLKKDWGSIKAIKQIAIKKDHIVINIELKYPVEHAKTALIASLQETLSYFTNYYSLDIHFTWKVESHAVQPGVKTLPLIKNILAVASGKGGVGKSTLAVNLALALAHEGASVGLLDADIYGPSQPMMLGATEPPEIEENKAKKILLPIRRHGIQSMSIGYLVNPRAAMIWRGPMVTTALQQLLHDTQWDALDYLIIDLPPGTGDIQLTLAQKIPVTAALIVTTPQDLALLDARRAYEMFHKVNIPILGVVENMSGHVCSQCGHAEAIFGQGGGERFANDIGMELLGRLPLDRTIREQTDAGNPPVAADPESHIAHLYQDIALRLAAKVSLQPKDYSHTFTVRTENGSTAA